MIVRVAPVARRQMIDARHWWRRNRHKAPNAFDEDIDEVLTQLADEPRAGLAVRGRLRGMRRIYLARIRYYLYYRVLPEFVQVTAIRHAARRPRREP